jgi:hypothetical protein
MSVPQRNSQRATYPRERKQHRSTNPRRRLSLAGCQCDDGRGLSRLPEYGRRVTHALGDGDIRHRRCCVQTRGGERDANTDTDNDNDKDKNKDTDKDTDTPAATSEVSKDGLCVAAMGPSRELNKVGSTYDNACTRFRRSRVKALIRSSQLSTYARGVGSRGRDSERGRGRWR